MKKAPKIGERVRYLSTELIAYEKGPRTCTGIITKLYPRHDDKFDDDGEFVRRGPLLPESGWKVCMQVDRPLPKWWGYGQDCDVFAPGVDELEAL